MPASQSGRPRPIIGCGRSPIPLSRRGGSTMHQRWQWHRVLFVAAALSAAGAGGFLAVRSTGAAAGQERVPQAPAPSDPGRAEDVRAIQKNQAAYVKAFNAGDARA